MEMQKIGPLLMDYALGATDAEVSALIEALAAKDADVQTQLQQWGEVTALAKRAEPEREMANVPVFPRQELESARRVAIWRRTAVQIVALAACLMLGFFAGSRLSGRAAVSSNDAPQIAVTSAPVTGEGPVAAVKDFWSPARLMAVAQSNAERPAPARSSSVGNLSTVFSQFGG
jgi:hypothetical protein